MVVKSILLIFFLLAGLVNKSFGTEPNCIHLLRAGAMYLGGSLKSSQSPFPIPTVNIFPIPSPVFQLGASRSGNQMVLSAADSSHYLTLEGNKPPHVISIRKPLSFSRVGALDRVFFSPYEQDTWLGYTGSEPTSLVLGQKSKIRWTETDVSISAFIAETDAVIYLTGNRLILRSTVNGKIIANIPAPLSLSPPGRVIPYPYLTVGGDLMLYNPADSPDVFFFRIDLGSKNPLQLIQHIVFPERFIFGLVASPTATSTGVLTGKGLHLFNFNRSKGSFSPVPIVPSEATWSVYSADGTHLVQVSFGKITSDWRVQVIETTSGQEVYHSSSEQFSTVPGELYGSSVFPDIGGGGWIILIWTKVKNEIHQLHKSNVQIIHVLPGQSEHIAVFNDLPQIQEVRVSPDQKWIQVHLAQNYLGSRILFIRRGPGSDNSFTMKDPIMPGNHHYLVVPMIAP